MKALTKELELAVIKLVNWLWLITFILLAIKVALSEKLNPFFVQNFPKIVIPDKYFK